MLLSLYSVVINVYHLDQLLQGNVPNVVVVFLFVSCSFLQEFTKDVDA